MKKTVKVKGEYIQLNQLLKLENIAMSGGHAREMIEEGLVKVNGTVESQIRKKIRNNDTVEVGKVCLVVLTDPSEQD